STDYLRNGKATQFVRITGSEIVVEEGDIILLWDGSNAGELFLGKKGILSSTMVCLSLKKDYYSKLFLFYLLKLKEHFLKGQTKGTGIPHVDKNVLKSLILPLPPLPEQQKIAEILSTVDNAIQKVDEAIAKTERLKKGLMQELLTKGIGHKEFKDTEIGRIPEEWGVVRLGELTKVTVGYVGKINEYYTTENDGVPLLSTTNISENGIKLDEIKYVSKEFHSKNKKSQVFPGDIIIARHGMSGTAATIPEFLKEVQCLNVVIVRSSQKFYSKFVEYLFNFEPTRRRLLGWKSGSVQGVVNTKVLEKFRIPLPSLPEQRKIAEILSIVDKKLELERKRKEKLDRIKKGLMNDLLTGKRRVRSGKYEEVIND
ncbi:MAG TPA: restriction endonuclease subunit S, partial [Candidatus Atribacteria bacterium]|nr:restriction endonuclease subunit S [Candidatus Atribacteria bacterium]